MMYYRYNKNTKYKNIIKYVYLKFKSPDCQPTIRLSPTILQVVVSKKTKNKKNCNLLNIMHTSLKLRKLNFRSIILTWTPDGYFDCNFTGFLQFFGSFFSRLRKPLGKTCRILSTHLYIISYRKVPSTRKSHHGQTL